jgi:hypothetical protein
MKIYKWIVAFVIALVVVGAGHAAIVDNSGPPLKKPELSDAEKEKQMTGPNFVPSTGTTPFNSSKNAPGIGSDEEAKTAVSEALAKPGKGDEAAMQALQQAAEDVSSNGMPHWFRTGFLGLLFLLLGFAVVLALKKMAEKPFGAGPPPRRKK